MKNNISICTDLVQSNELAKILPVDSSDMYYEDDTSIEIGHAWHSQHIPCWSLAALLHIISQYSDYTIDNTNGKIVAFVSPFNSYNVIRCENTQFVGLCVDIIHKLNENKLL